MSMSDQKPNIFRRRYLIDYKLQLSLVLYFLAIAVAVAIGTYFILSEALDGYIDEVRAGLPGLNQETFAIALEDFKINILRDFIIASLAGLVGVLVGGILVSHRISGPLYHMEKSLRTFVETGKFEEIQFRKHDYAKNLAELYNKAMKKAAN